jgi:lipoate-protein ligase A
LSPSQYELLLRGYKIVGSAQRRLKRSFLQHGSIPLQVDYPQMAAALGIQEKVLRKTLLSVSEVSGHPVCFAALCQALKEGFEETFQVQLKSFRQDAGAPLFSTLRLLWQNCVPLDDYTYRVRQ